MIDFFVRELDDLPGMKRLPELQSRHIGIGGRPVSAHAEDIPAQSASLGYRRQAACAQRHRNGNFQGSADCSRSISNLSN